MSTSRSFAGVKHILCPTDLTANSQKSLSFAAQIAATLDAKLTAFHSAVDSWLYRSEEQFKEGRAEIEAVIRRVAEGVQDTGEGVLDLDVIIEKNSDPVSAIPILARELNAGMIVMRARPGTRSAFHFGSIVERIISDASCPVLLMPSRFLADRDPDIETLSFRRILFDYDFSQATDDLFHVANALVQDYSAELHVLSVLEPPTVKDVEFSVPVGSQLSLQSAVQDRLRSAIRSEGISSNSVPTSVVWGPHAERVLEYAGRHQIDLICTALPLPNVPLGRLYRGYLGELLASATCPVLLKQCV